MQGPIERAKADFLQARAGLLHALSNTPDERLDWSPSPMARSPLHLVAHAAESLGHIRGNLEGRTFAVPTTAEADRGFRENEARFATRESVLGALHEQSDALVAFLDGLDPDRLGEAVASPFGMGPAPMELAITFPALHTRWHHAQLDYLQTIYGDHEWHL